MEKSEKQLLIEANTIIRSFYSIIERHGNNTNWEIFAHRVEEILEEQHEYLFPTIKQIRRKKLNNINGKNSE